MKFDEHPTVLKLRSGGPAAPQNPSGLVVPLTISSSSPALSSEALRRICLDAGADDVGFVSIDNPAVAFERDGIEAAFPGVRTLVSIVSRMQQENVRSPMRSIANQAFHTTGHHVDEICRRVVLALQDMNIRACNPSMAFPMEISNIPEEKAWVVSHKVVAQAAGLGKMGLHRSVIHPKFGSFILLGTLLIDREVDMLSSELDYNPCVDCRLCVAACPVGAISADGHFDASACMTHNYREFLGGFTDWVETVTNSSGERAYRERMEDPETLSMWQSLAYGPNYKAAYCLAVCPAGEDVLGPFIDARAQHVERVVRPLQQKSEPIYVVRGSDAERYVQRRMPHKRLRYVRSGIRPTSVSSFLRPLQWLFQREQSAGLAARYHFIFAGKENVEATIDIRDKKIDIQPGLVGKADVRITADSQSWVKFLRRETSLAWILLTGRLRLSPLPRGAKLLAAFGRCFPA